MSAREALPPPAAEGAPIRLRQTLRDVQKRRTRRKLHAAGKQLFAHGGYMTCTVEEIVKAAGISRAAFYLHFKSKHALLRDIIASEYRWQRRRYRSLKSDPEPTAEELAAWISRFIKGFAVGRDILSLYHFASSIDADVQAMAYKERQQFVLELNRQVPAFWVIGPSGDIDAERYAGLHLLLFEMEQLCMQIALGYWSTDPDIAIRTLVKRFLDFGYPAPAAN